MANIHNFTNRHLCEYASIYPTVASLLDHLLFTIGNGYDVDNSSGMIVDGAGLPITEHPSMTPEEWDILIQQCHQKEKDYAVRFNAAVLPEDLAYLEKCCEMYKVFDIDDSAFTEQALYSNLVNMQAVRRQDDPGFYEYHLRPYPLSTAYSDIYHLNDNTPKWFLQIAINFVKAWTRFLTEAIDKNDVWEYMPYIPDPDLDKMADDIISEIMGIVPGQAKKYPEKTTDYADIIWTTRHRDMLIKCVGQLESLLDCNIGSVK
jgi:hypothetical protein